MFDYHCHTSFSNDCETEMEDMIVSAIEKGLKEICFTDHVDYDYKDDSISFEIDEVKYLETIAHFQKKYADKITILKGLELGLQPTIYERCSELVDRIKPDFVLCSMHTCNELDLFNGDFYIGKSGRESYESYWIEMGKIVDEYDDFSVVGHLDVVKRYNDETRQFDTDKIMESVEIVLKKIIKKGKGIEVNSSGIRGGLYGPLPNWNIIKKYYDLGGRIITFGSDSHIAKDVGHSYDEVTTKLKDIGFTHITSFKNMEPIMRPL